MLKCMTKSQLRISYITWYKTVQSLNTKVRAQRYHNFIKTNASQGRTIRIPLLSGNVIGSAVSYQEDSHAIAALSLNPKELQAHLAEKLGVLSWDPGRVGPELAGQVVFVGIYDGHGGPSVSQFLQQELHGLFESVQPELAPDVISWMKSQGGYFKRFKGGALERWAERGAKSPTFGLEARCTLAFLEADKRISEIPESEKCGATSSVVLLHSLEVPASPFFSSHLLSLTVAHCGDTRVLLCTTEGGSAYPLTETHHADARGEAARLRRLGAGLVTDSFGEARQHPGVSYITTRFRSSELIQSIIRLGDFRYKAFGVTPEPEITSKLLNAGEQYAFAVLVSDGITSTLSDAEIVDVARGAPDPQKAAKAIVSLAEELGSEDNATALVVPLAGWGKTTGIDKTLELRNYRKKMMIGTHALIEAQRARATPSELFWGSDRIRVAPDPSGYGTTIRFRKGGGSDRFSHWTPKGAEATRRMNLNSFTGTRHCSRSPTAGFFPILPSNLGEETGDGDDEANLTYMGSGLTTPPNYRVAINSGRYTKGSHFLHAMRYIHSFGTIDEERFYTAEMPFWCELKCGRLYASWRFI
ncbi:protein phosphatase 2c isoform [Rhizoctonia solani AG-1 IA]|uniref:Protein phosphatase 2c isoform n=1 Tax=Thanatephorus cucumeris (strain AG1-IA) TaxID=983506 RepID=L8WXU9_THACA|nr:protein phosphatase 2c isoform [Rhizoctonia solani AG-1 IA]